MLLFARSTNMQFSRSSVLFRGTACRLVRVSGPDVGILYPHFRHWRDSWEAKPHSKRCAVHLFLFPFWIQPTERLVVAAIAFVRIFNE